MYVDLHMHSMYSDGHNTPAELVEMAIEKQLAAISLTDHDCLDGVPEFMELGKKAGIEVLTGVELSSEFNGRDLHILGYGIDPGNEEFQERLRTFRDTRYKRGLKIVEKLNDLGIEIEPSEVLAKAGGGTLGRPHVAQVLVDRGVVSNVGEAFDRFIAEGGPAYVPKYKMRPDEAIAHIRLAGGLAFAAHPGVFLENPDEMNLPVAD